MLLLKTYFSIDFLKYWKFLSQLLECYNKFIKYLFCYKILFFIFFLLEVVFFLLAVWQAFSVLKKNYAASSNKQRDSFHTKTSFLLKDLITIYLGMKWEKNK